MAEIVRMPKLSDTMTEGVVAEWHKKVGDRVKNGELLAEIETDKATMEFESFQDGVLLHIGVEKGKSAPIDSILAVLGAEGEDISALLAAEKNVAPKQAAPAPATASPEPAAATVTASAPVAPEQDSVAPTPATIQSAPIQARDNGRMLASPLARRLAEEKGIDLRRVAGSGDGGRIIKRDVDAHTGTGAARMSVQQEAHRDEPVSQMRKTIARRLGESKFSAPHFYLTMRIDMGAMVDARRAINEVASAKVSFNDIIIKSCAMALRKHPAVNASWRGDFIRYNSHVHIGVAVAVDEGLLVPVVRFADTKTLSQIATEVRDMAKKAHDKKLQPADWEGNTFTVSNLGMFGIEEFTAIINPPDACIMAIGAIVEDSVVRNGQVVPGHTMRVTLSCDHRVVDGAKGSEFLQTFKKLMENPVLLLGMDSI
jgi:pyruvate dehydrogenase E2 component (dihydrolipoamide acetyltransferase)